MSESRQKPWPARTRGAIDGMAWPPVVAGLRATLASLVRQLDETQWLAPDEIAAEQRRQLGIVARHAARHSPQFGTRLAAAGLAPEDLATPAGLRRLPVLRRRDIQSAGDALFAAEVPKQHQPLTERRTSGSTGEPVMVKRTTINGLMWAAFTVRDYLWHGADFAGRFSAIRAGVAGHRKAPDWGRPVNLLFQSGPAQVMPIATDIKQQLAWLREFQPNTLLTYPSNLEALAEACADAGVGLPGLRWLRTIGATLSPRMRETVRQVFGLPVVDLYSSEEFGVIAIQCPDSELYHVMAESVIVEVLDEQGQPCKPGEIGALAITDLHNFATPLIRYALADYAEAAGPCSCGRGLPTLKRIVGRERNLMTTPDGRRFWPSFGRQRYRAIAPIQQCQFIQETPDSIEFRYQAERKLSAAQEAALGAVVRDNLNYPFSFRFTHLPDGIPRGANGKFEEFISKVPR